MLERLTDRSTDIVVGTDRKGRVVYYNDGATKSLGYHPDEVLGSFVGKLYPSVEEARRVASAMRSVKHGGAQASSRRFPTTFLAKNGEEIPVAISGTLIFDDGSRKTAPSVTRRTCATFSTRTSSRFSARSRSGSSHEINNPLAVILNQAMLLESDLARLAGERDTSSRTNASTPFAAKWRASPRSSNVSVRW